jgi:peptidoglycan/xylan/chitin deacetylase (PgdA/CDA1 family)
VARGEAFLAPNSVAQLRQLVEAGVEVGAHTRSHADLGRITTHSRLAGEILGCREELQQRLGCAVRYFAFPYGQFENLNVEAFRLSRAAGLAGVCSAYGGYNFPGGDSFHLQRIHGDPHFPRFRNWLTLDPRLLSVRRFDYELR